MRPEQRRFDPILVTGASGFVGACVVRELVARRQEVHILLRRDSQTWRLDDLRERVVVHRGSLLDAEAIRAVVLEVRPRTVLHLATHGAYESQADARAILQTNILGTHHLLAAAAEAGVEIFVNTGSSSEYGFKTQPMRETDRLEPNSFYAVAKAAQTHLCSVLAGRGGMSVVTFRLFSVYGPWEEPTRLVPTILRRARAGLPLEMVSPETARDFVFVDDVVEALLDFPRLAALSGEVMNLGTGRETTLGEFVATVKDLLGSSSPVCWGAFPARHWDSNRWVADPEKAKSLIGWEPRYTLAEGLARMAAWMEQEGVECGDSGRRSSDRPYGDRESSTRIQANTRPDGPEGSRAWGFKPTSRGLTSAG
jgi:nucleoside-diphosphate-sugar epimerase